MCRYGLYGPYKAHFACFDCRKMFRRPARCELARPPRKDEQAVAPCPQCGVPMHDLGLDFKAPKQTDVEQWEKVAALHRHGYTFHSCGCGGPGPRPPRLKDVGPFLMEQQRLRADFERLQRLSTEAANRTERWIRAAKIQQNKGLARQGKEVIQRLLGTNGWRKVGGKAGEDRKLEWWADELWTLEALPPYPPCRVCLAFVIVPRWRGPRKKREGVWAVTAALHHPAQWSDVGLSFGYPPAIQLPLFFAGLATLRSEWGQGRRQAV